MRPAFFRDASGYDSAWLDRDEILDYQVDWSRWLNGDTIVTSTWASDNGVTISDSSNTTTTATVWLTLLKSDMSEVTNTITTAAGRKKQITLRFYERDS